MKKHPTQADVAKLAGVARSTVSYVLNQQSGGPIPISEETRKRVLDAMQELGYAPDPGAQMLAQGSTNLIGIFTYEPNFPYDQEDFYFPFLTGIEREAGRHGYNVVLFTHQPDAGRQIFINGINSLRLADGTILMGMDPDREELKRLVQEQYPFVFIGRREIPDHAIDWVVSDYQTVSAEATQHLIDLGHRRIGFITLDDRYEADKDRIAGCQQAINKASGVNLVIKNSADIQDSESLHRMLKQHKLTALIYKDDTLLDESLKFIQELSLNIPDDLSIITLDGGSIGAAATRSFSRVDLNQRQVGEAAARTLIARLKDSEEEPQQIYIPTKFIIGDTTAKAKQNVEF